MNDFILSPDFVSFSSLSLFVFSAIDLINNLLQVKMRKRYSVDKSLSHSYLQVTYQHYCTQKHTHDLELYEIYNKDMIKCLSGT